MGKEGTDEIKPFPWLGSACIQVLEPTGRTYDGMASAEHDL
jgi:hypothetical protein